MKQIQEDKIISEFLKSLGPWRELVVIGGGFALFIYKTILLFLCFYPCAFQEMAMISICGPVYAVFRPPLPTRRRWRLWRPWGFCRTKTSRFTSSPDASQTIGLLCPKIGTYIFSILCSNFGVTRTSFWQARETHVLSRKPVHAIFEAKISHFTSSLDRMHAGAFFCPHFAQQNWGN